VELTNDIESYYKFDPILVESFHFDSIKSLDVCESKPLMVTCGKDNMFSIWNYESGKLEYAKYFEEELNSVSIHPIGLFVAISFFDKINFFTIYVDDLKCTKVISLGNLNLKFLLNLFTGSIIL
jgi:WD40 repeat protein